MTVEQSTKDWLRERLGTDLSIEKHAYYHQDDVYKIHAGGRNFYLKTNLSLQAEHDNITRLRSYLNVPDIIGFARIGGKDHLLMTEVRGDNLAELAGRWSDGTIIQEFARAVKRFHALDIKSIFLEYDGPAGSAVLHGDMAMPNLIFTAPGQPSYIDLGQMSVGSVDVDLADALWSLQRNIGPGHGEQFLQEYGDVVMTERIDKALKFVYIP